MPVLVVAKLVPPKGGGVQSGGGILQKRAKELEKEVTELQDTIKVLKGEIVDQRSEYESKKTLSDPLVRNLERFRNTLDAANKKQVNNPGETNKDKYRDSAAKEAAVSKAQKDYDDERSKLPDAVKETAKEKAKLEDLEAELKTKKAEFDEANTLYKNTKKAAKRELEEEEIAANKDVTKEYKDLQRKVNRAADAYVNAIPSNRDRLFDDLTSLQVKLENAGEAAQIVSDRQVELERVTKKIDDKAKASATSANKTAKKDFDSALQKYKADAEKYVEKIVEFLEAVKDETSPVPKLDVNTDMLASPKSLDTAVNDFKDTTYHSKALASKEFDSEAEKDTSIATAEEDLKTKKDTLAADSGNIVLIVGNLNLLIGRAYDLATEIQTGIFKPLEADIVDPPNLGTALASFPVARGGRPRRRAPAPVPAAAVPVPVPVVDPVPVPVPVPAPVVDPVVDPAAAVPVPDPAAAVPVPVPDPAAAAPPPLNPAPPLPATPLKVTIASLKVDLETALKTLKDVSIPDLGVDKADLLKRLEKNDFDKLDGTLTTVLNQVRASNAAVVIPTGSYDEIKQQLARDFPEATVYQTASEALGNLQTSVEDLGEFLKNKVGSPRNAGQAFYVNLLTFRNIAIEALRPAEGKVADALRAAIAKAAELVERYKQSAPPPEAPQPPPPEAPQPPPPEPEQHPNRQRLIQILSGFFTEADYDVAVARAANIRTHEDFVNLLVKIIEYSSNEGDRLPEDFFPASFTRSITLTGFFRNIHPDRCATIYENRRNLCNGLTAKINALVVDNFSDDRNTSTAYKDITDEIIAAAPAAAVPVPEAPQPPPAAQAPVDPQVEAEIEGAMEQLEGQARADIAPAALAQAAVNLDQAGGKKLTPEETLQKAVLQLGLTLAVTRLLKGYKEERKGKLNEIIPKIKTRNDVYLRALDKQHQSRLEYFDKKLDLEVLKDLSKVKETGKKEFKVTPVFERMPFEVNEKHVKDETQTLNDARENLRNAKQIVFEHQRDLTNAKTPAQVKVIKSRLDISRDVLKEAEGHVTLAEQNVKQIKKAFVQGDNPSNAVDLIKTGYNFAKKIQGGDVYILMKETATQDEIDKIFEMPQPNTIVAVYESKTDAQAAISELKSLSSAKLSTIFGMSGGSRNRTYRRKIAGKRKTPRQVKLKPVLGLPFTPKRNRTYRTSKKGSRKTPRRHSS